MVVHDIMIYEVEALEMRIEMCGVGPPPLTSDVGYCVRATSCVFIGCGLATNDG